MASLLRSQTHNVGRRKFLMQSASGAAVAASGLLFNMGSAYAASSTEELYAAAKKEGKLVWWCGCLDRPAMDAVRKEFIATYPGIDLQALWQTGEVTYTRVQQNLKAGVHDVDVFGTSNAGHWPLLKKQGSLAPFEPSGAPSLSKLFKSPDPDHLFHAAGVEVVIIDYRSDKIKQPPTKWTDFLDPKWNNKITTGSPLFSGDMVNWTIAMLDKYGDKYLKELAKRNPKVGRSILGTGTDILSGERLLGMGVDANTFYLKAGGNPIDVQFPEDDAILAVGYTGILKTAPHPNAARLFMEFTDSKEYSKAMVSAYRFPIRSDVKSFSGIELDKEHTYQSTIERLAEGTAEARTKWQEAMGI